ncbi:MAG: addiction module protein [Verrucomicrobiota bacterium]
MMTETEAAELTLQEKLKLTEILWTDISKEEHAVEVPQWHKDLLDNREAEYQNGNTETISWEEAKQQIRAARR